MGEAADSEPSVRRTVRRRRVEGGRRHHHKVRVTPEEEGRLLALALRYGVSVPKLLVDSALATGAEVSTANLSVRRELVSELFAVHRLLGTIANNVNQVARVANATGQVQPGTSVTLAKVRETAERIDRLLDDLSAGGA